MSSDVCAAGLAAGAVSSSSLAKSAAAYDAHQAPVPPPPRPPRPLKVPGYLFTAHTTVEAAQWMQQQVFYTGDRSLAQSVRHNQPVFLLDTQAGQLHGVFRRTDDPQQLLQDLTHQGGPAGYQVHVQPLYVFPAPVSLAAIEDVLIEQQPHGDACTTQQQQNGSSRLRYEPVLGSQQHGVLWEAFMRAAKKQQKALALIQEEAQQQQHCGGACANGVNGCS